MKIRCPGGKLAGHALKVLENEIRFAENGLAEAAHLTDAEVQRLVRFGFQIVPEPRAAQAPQNPVEAPKAVTAGKEPASEDSQKARSNR